MFGGPQTTWLGGNKNQTERQKDLTKKNVKKKSFKKVDGLHEAIKTWLSEFTFFSDANVPEAAILFIVARHNIGHLPVNVSVIPSPCFINLPLLGPTEWNCGSWDDGGG